MLLKSVFLLVVLFPESPNKKSPYSIVLFSTCSIPFFKCQEEKTDI